MALLLSAVLSDAQISIKDTPPSFQYKLSKTDIPELILPDYNYKAMLVEDKINESIKNIPYRYAKEHTVDYSIKEMGGMSDLPNGGKVYRLSIISRNAYSLHFVFSDYHLPDGARLFLYNKDRTQLIGAFTSFNNYESAILATAEVEGDQTIIEYYEPQNPEFEASLKLSKVFHAYRDILSHDTKDGYFGHSGACNLDINCIEGNGWQAEKHAVCRLSMGTSLCSGTILNNTANDKTPYFLTAQHCIGNSDFNQWVFYFNYESPFCNGPDGSINQTLSGCELKAEIDSLDFCLVEMNSEPPASYSPYFAGWSNSPDPDMISTCIHHPAGDVKKITRDNNYPVSATYGSGSYCEDGHWKIEEWDWGTTEGGSSGSPLFDHNHHVVGSLTGGDASCNYNYNDFYAKFTLGWDKYSDSSAQLKYWLDPIDSNVTIMSAYNPYDIGYGCDSSSNYEGTPTIYKVTDYGGFVSGNNTYGDLAKAEYFNNQINTVKVTGAYLKFGYVTRLNSASTTKVAVSVWSDSGGLPAVMLAVDSLPLSDIMLDSYSDRFSQATFYPAPIVSDAFYITVELPQSEGDTVVLYTNTTFDAIMNTAYEMGSNGSWSSYSNAWGINLNHNISAITCIQSSVPVNTFTDSEQIKVYPNPTSGILTIEFSDNKNDCSIKLLDIMGRSVFICTEKSDSKKLFLKTESLSEGVYFLLITSNDQKIVKKITVAK